jgi:hypothetical protein
MVTALSWFRMTLLADGTVLTAGVTYDNIHSEIYDPSTGTRTAAGDIAGGRPGFTLTYFTSLQSQPPSSGLRARL